MAYLSLILLISAALFSGLSVLSLLITIRSRKEHRNTIFPIVRESEGIKAKRAAIASGVFLLLTALSIGGWVATQQDPDNVLIAREATQQALLQQSLSAVTPVVEVSPIAGNEAPPGVGVVQGQADSTVFSEAPTNTPEIAKATVVIAVEATETPVAASQETASPPATAPGSTQKASPIPIPEGISIGPIAFAANINDKQEALDPTEVFNANIQKVYAAFPYRGMKNGLPFSVIWYYQNIEIVRDDFEWDWGSKGQSYFFVRPRNAGDYRIEFRINDEIVAGGSFEVTP